MNEPIKAVTFSEVPEHIKQNKDQPCWCKLKAHLFSAWVKNKIDALLVYNEYNIKIYIASKQDRDWSDGIRLWQWAQLMNDYAASINTDWFHWAMSLDDFVENNYVIPRTTPSVDNAGEYVTILNPLIDNPNLE